MLNIRQVKLFLSTARSMSSLLILSFILYCYAPAVSQSSVVKQELSSQEYALDLLKKMSDNVASLPQFGFHLEIIDDYTYEDGLQTQLEESMDLTMDRKNGIWVDLKGDYNHKRFWYDGDNITLLTVLANLYATEEVSGTMDEVLDLLFDKYNVTIPMTDLLYSNPFEVLTENIIYGFYAGLHSVDDTPCHHLIFIQDNIDWQIWIEEGPKALPRKLLIKYKNEPEKPDHVVKVIKWDYVPYSTDQFFKFIPPPGAIEIEFLDNSK